jgi:hypothetical protein
MKVDKVKYTAQYEAGRRVAEWIGIEASPDAGETADEAFKAAQDQVNKWHNESNPGLHLDMGLGSLPIQWANAEPIVPDPAFEELKRRLEHIEYREHAINLINNNGFRLNIELNKIANSKPLKND